MVDILKAGNTSSIFTGSETGWELKVGGFSNDATSDFGTIRIHKHLDEEADRLQRRKKTKPIVKRRFNGFFIQQEGDNARVALVTGGELIHYYLPYDQLKKAGIKFENQPFEVDELIIEEDGIPFRGYRFRALASRKDASTVPLPLGDKTEEKLKYILDQSKRIGG